MERNRPKIAEESLRRFIAENTAETYETVMDRLKAILGTSEADRLWLGLLNDFDNSIRNGGSLGLYRTGVNLGNFLRFGVKVQLVNLKEPIKFEEKDEKLMESLQEVCQALETGEYPEIRETLNAIPESLGSMCDRGDFDGYDQEVLTVVFRTATCLKHLLPSMYKPLDARERVEIFRKFAPDLKQVYEGLRSSDREKIFTAETKITSKLEPYLLRKREGKKKKKRWLLF